jgi:hypothetical protein
VKKGIVMHDQDIEILTLLLFSTFSRNRHFAHFEEDRWRSLRQTAKIIRRLRQDIQRPKSHHSSEKTTDGKIKIRWHCPHIGVTRTVFLTPAQWDLVWDQRWANLR